jgi:hypothetical protein
MPPISPIRRRRDPWTNWRSWVIRFWMGPKRSGRPLRNPPVPPRPVERPPDVSPPLPTGVATVVGGTLVVVDPPPTMGTVMGRSMPNDERIWRTRARTESVIWPTSWMMPLVSVTPMPAALIPGAIDRPWTSRD